MPHLPPQWAHSAPQGSTGGGGEKWDVRYPVTSQSQHPTSPCFRRHEKHSVWAWTALSVICLLWRASVSAELSWPGNPASIATRSERKHKRRVGDTVDMCCTKISCLHKIQGDWSTVCTAELHSSRQTHRGRPLILYRLGSRGKTEDRALAAAE